MKRRLAIWLAWKNFSEYYSGQLAVAIADHYDVTITYKRLDWNEFDIVMPFFPLPRRRPKCDKKKIVQPLWEPHEFGWGKEAQVVLAASTTIFKRIKDRFENVVLTPWAINPTHFPVKPFPIARELRVGWAGSHENPRKQFQQLEAAMNSMEGVDFIPNKVTGRGGAVLGPYTMETMHEYYGQIHVYVCGSANEGFGFPLLEAAACGRPIVTFDVGVARDLERSGVGIIIVNSLREMQRAVWGIDYEELGRKSAEAVRKSWLWKHVRGKWLDALAHAG